VVNKPDETEVRYKKTKKRTKDKLRAKLSGPALTEEEAEHVKLENIFEMSQDQK